MTDAIRSVSARRVWDSRGPADRRSRDHDARAVRAAAAIAPSGASTGRREAIELRDGGSALGGKDVTQRGRHRRRARIAACAHGHDIARPGRRGRGARRLDADPQRAESGRQLHDGGRRWRCCMPPRHPRHPRVAPSSMPSRRFIPRPQIQILGGGAHAAHRTAVQDFMVMPLSATTIADGLVHVAEVYLRGRRGPRRARPPARRRRRGRATGRR